MDNQSHSFTKKINGLPYKVCIFCGLIRLNNDFTSFCVKNGCSDEDHPDYESQKKKVKNYIKH